MLRRPLHHLRLMNVRLFRTSGMNPSSGVEGGSKMMDIQVSEDESEAQITLPGYSFGDLNRAGIPSVWKVATMGEAARIAFYKQTDRNGRTFAHLEELFKTRLIFLLCARYTIRPEFYKMEHMYHPLNIDYKLNYLGKSSFSFIDKTYSEKTGDLLHDALLVQVAVDRKTKKAGILPDWYHNKYKVSGTAWTFTPPDKPAKTFTNPYRVAWSDTDYYYHVNHASYIRLAMDTTAEAAIKGHLAGFTEDPGHLRVREMKMLYAAESKPHDNLVIHAWADKKQDKTLHCQIDKENAHGKPVFFMTTQYY